MDFSVVLVSIYLLVILLLFCGVWIYMFCKRYHRYFDGIVTERHCCRRIIEQLEKSWSKNHRMGSFFSKLNFQFNHSVTRSDCQINEEYDRYQENEMYLLIWISQICSSEEIKLKDSYIHANVPNPVFSQRWSNISQLVI